MRTVDKDLNVKVIFAAMNTAWAVVKTRSEKIQACMGYDQLS